MTLQEMNNKFKLYVNEASGISVKCKRELIRMVARDFYVDLPKENYLNIDFKILQNGNIVMRDVEYETSNPVQDMVELTERFNNFEVNVKRLLDTNATNFKTMRRNNEIGNLLLVILLTLLFIAAVGYGINRFLEEDYGNLIWVVIMFVIYFIPAMNGRLIRMYKRAFKFIKNMFK